MGPIRRLMRGGLRSGIMMIILLLAPFLVYRYRFCERGGGNICFSKIDNTQPPISVGTYAPYTNLTTNIVVASIRSDNTDWLKKVRIPNLTVTRYTANDQLAEHHPPLNKGREATIYFTYIRDHYDDLADITIFMHADESPWHSETLLENSMSYTLNKLDLSVVEARGYANLRVGWKDGCPDWAKTNPVELDDKQPEAVYLWQAFIENFPFHSDGSLVIVPPILGGPCCSQFAVSRETIRAIPREQYTSHLDWMLKTEMSDSISGRTWEHMFQYLFTQKAVDCPVEWKTYCAMYRLCFEGPEQLQEFYSLEEEKKDLFGIKLSFLGKIFSPYAAKLARIEELRELALRRGRDINVRTPTVIELYAD